MTQIFIDDSHFRINGKFENHPAFGESTKIFKCISDKIEVHVFLDENQNVSTIRFYCAGYEVIPSNEIIDNTFDKIVITLVHDSI